jgi:signal transduction histidine kinase
MLDNSTAHFEASGASLFLLDEEDFVYRLRAKSGIDSRVPSNAEIYPGKGIAGTAALKRQPLLIGDPRRNPELDTKSVSRRKDLSSAMVVPLVSRESGTVGILNLSRAAGLAKFTSADLRKARTFASHLTLAVGNAMLFKRMDDVVREARAAQIRLRTVLECLGVGMMILDRDGLIVQRNLQFSTLTETHAIPGGNWRDALFDAPEALADAVHQIVEAAQRGQRERMRVECRTTDQSWVIAGFPMRVGAAIAIEETSEVDRLQRESARIKRLAEIGQMTAAIAHEIRNPLAGIIGAAQLAQDSPEDVKDLAKMIEQEAYKLNELCNDFLAFARPVSLRLAEVHLGEIAERVVEQHRREFDQAGVSISVEISPGEPAILADRNRLEQVCRNLVLNALQACQRGAHVRVVAQEGRLIVSDTGSGIDEKSLEQLFTPFFTTKASGTGLGLSNVRKILDAHGAKIAVESAPGQGTTFNLEFKQAA